MNPIDIIREDHRRVEDLFMAYEALDELAYDERRELVDEILAELELHTEMEETLAYPRFREALTEDDDRTIEEAYAEHEVAKHLIDDLKSLSPEDAEFGAKVAVLKETVEHHVLEEEESMLTEVESAMGGEELAALGEAMQAFKEEHAIATL
jgi:hypothetical protein